MKLLTKIKISLENKFVFVPFPRPNQKLNDTLASRVAIFERCSFMFKNVLSYESACIYAI